MKNFYHKTISCITEYNRIQDKMAYGQAETTDLEDEFIENYPWNFAEALICDAGDSKFAQEQLCCVARIILDAYISKDA